MNRQLHCMEALFALESRLGRRNTGFVFVTTAPVPDVPAALAAVQRRHPVLRSRLTTDVRSWEPCCSDVAHHISLDERPLPEGDLLDVCARELERNLERALVTQLLHIVVLGGRAFVCVFSHVLFDGASRLIFARDVVRASAGLDLGVEQPVHSNVIDLLRLRDDVPPAEDKPIVPPEAFAPLPPDCADAGADHHVAVDVYEFDVRDALQRCRDHGVTLNSALMTALVYAAVPGRPAAVVGCPINGRKRCGLPDTELINAGIPSGAVVTGSLPFWQAAALAGASLQSGQTSNRTASVVVRSFQATLDRKRLEAVPSVDPVTNLDVLMIVSNMGQCKVDGVDVLFGCQGRAHGASMQVHVHTVGHRCFLSSGFLTPLYDVGRMRGILRNAVDTIRP